MSDSLQDFVIKVDSRVVPLFHATGIIYPMWHIENAAGKIEVITDVMPDKDVAAIAMRAYFALTNPARYAFIDEAWVAYLPASTVGADELERLDRIGLRDHPGRLEVLLYQVEDETGSATGQRLIIREKGKHRPTLGPLEFWRSNFSEGRFVGMLPRKGTTQ